VKCPCCGTQVFGRLLWSDGYLYFPDGTHIPLAGHEGKVFRRLLQGPVTIPQDQTHNGQAVAVSRLRTIFIDMGLPYRIRTDRANHLYILESIPDEQNNDAAERTENVHSRPRLHDI